MLKKNVFFYLFYVDCCQLGNKFSEVFRNQVLKYLKGSI